MRFPHSWPVEPRRLERIQQVLAKRQPTLRVFMDEVVNEHNFSAILRTCDAVGVLYVHFTYTRGEELPISNRITQGAHHWLRLIREEDPLEALQRLRKEGFQIVATVPDPKAQDFRTVDYTLPTVVLVGNEARGVQPSLLRASTHRIWIPMHGMAQSLNVSVATAVILYEAERQRRQAGMYDRPQLSPTEMETLLRIWTLERRILGHREEKAQKGAKRTETPSTPSRADEDRLNTTPREGQ